MEEFIISLLNHPFFSIFCSLLLSLFYIASILVLFSLYCITFLEIANPSVILKIIIQNQSVLVTSLPWPYRQMYSCIRQKGGRTSSKSPRR